MPAAAERPESSAPQIRGRLYFPPYKDNRRESGPGPESLSLGFETNRRSGGFTPGHGFGIRRWERRSDIHTDPIGRFDPFDRIAVTEFSTGLGSGSRQIGIAIVVGCEADLHRPARAFRNRVGPVRRTGDAYHYGNGKQHLKFEKIFHDLNF